MEQNILAIHSRRELRDWFMIHAEDESECWIEVKRGKPVDPTMFYYIDAVEEALCFGWIDSTIKHIDETHRAQRFTPRKKGSPYSRPNIERLIWLDEHDLIHPSVRESVLPIIRQPFVFPPDIIKALKKDQAVWETYQQFPEAYRRIRVAYIEAARTRPEEFEKRLNSFIDKTRRGKMIGGYGGIDKYYH